MMPLAFHLPFMDQSIVLAVLGLLLVGSALWIWMLVDCLTSDLPSTDKLTWTLVILFLHVLGAVLYLTIGRPRRGRAG